MRGQMGGVLLCSPNVMQLYSCWFTVSVSFSSKQEVLICDAQPPSMQKLSFWPQLSLVVVGRLAACPSLSPVYMKLSVCLSVHKLAKIAVLLRVEFTLDPLFAPPETRSLAPSFLPFALCHQSPTVSKNSSIVIVTDLPRFSAPPPCRTQEAASHVLFICLEGLFWLTL